MSKYRNYSQQQQPQVQQIVNQDEMVFQVVIKHAFDIYTMHATNPTVSVNQCVKLSVTFLCETGQLLGATPEEITEKVYELIRKKKEQFQQQQEEIRKSREKLDRMKQGEIYTGDS